MTHVRSIKRYAILFHRLLFSALLFLAGAFVLLGALVPSANAQTETTSVLHWSNGDSLPGQFVSATAARLKWQSTLFKDNAEIDLKALEAITFSSAIKYRKPSEPFLLQMKNGDRIYADIVKLDDSTVTIQSTRMGRRVLSKDSVLEITHLKRAELVTIPALHEWKSLGKARNDWKELPDGRFHVARKNTNLSWQTKLPETVEIELVVAWKKHLDFSFGFGAPTNLKGLENIPRVDSWDGSLVLTNEEDLEILYDEIDQKKKRLRLFIHLDNKNKHVKVYDKLGKLLGEMDLPKRSRWVTNGIYFANKEGDLTIETLRIGKASKGFDSAKRGVLKTNGDSLQGIITGFDGTTWAVKKDDDATATFPAAEFRRAILNLPKENQTAAKSTLIVRYQDGTIVKGSLVSYSAEVMKIKTAYAQKPLECNLTGASEIRFVDTPKDSPAAKHIIYLENSKLRGELIPGSGKGGDVLRWKMVGQHGSSAVAKANARILLLNKDSKESPTGDQQALWPDTLYFVNRDLIPCRITSIDEKAIHFESFSEMTQVPHAEVKAIDFGMARLSAISTADKNWQFDKKLVKAVDRNGKQLVIRKKGHFGHPGLMRGNQLEFDMSWKRGTYSMLKLQPFVGNVLKPNSKLNITLMIYDTTIQVQNEGQEEAWGGMNNVASLQLNKYSAHVTLKALKGRLTLLINDKPIHVVKLSNARITGRGMAFSLNEINGFQQQTQFTFSKFLVSNTSEGGSTFLVSDEKKKHILTIPRLKIEHPPKHILCSKNGDVLRGEITSLDSTRVHFHAGMTDFVFLRKHISNIVWLHAEHLADDKEEKKDDSDKEKQPNRDSTKKTGTLVEKNATTPQVTKPQINNSDQQIVQVVFGTGQRITMAATAWKSDTLIGVSPSLGQCKIPMPQIQELRIGSFAKKATDVPYSDWVAVAAPKPKIASAESGESGGEGPVSPLVGTVVKKDFALVRLDGTKTKLSELRGKVVVLDFWATWCGPCVQALPEVMAAVESFDAKDVVLFAVNQGEEKETIEEFLQNHSDWKLTPALDPDGKIGRLFNVDGIPQTVIIDSKGKITYLHVGASPKLKENLIQQIQKASDGTAKKDSKEVKENETRPTKN